MLLTGAEAGVGSFHSGAEVDEAKEDVSGFQVARASLSPTT